MTFAQPWFLLGTLAALIPLLVHLFDRRRPRQVPFAALDFVLRSQRRTASRLRLKRLLLYLLRTLVLLAVPLALARPQWQAQGAALQARGLAATAVVVDTSLALRFRDEQPLFERAKDEARAALRELAGEEPATLVPCTRQPLPVAPLGFDRAPLVAAVDELSPGYESVDLNRCLDAALHALDESPLPNRRLVLVSALTQGALRLEAPPPAGTGPGGQPLKPELVVRDVARGRPLPNRAIVDLRAEAAPQLDPRAWQFTFTVRNFSNEAASDLELRLEVNGQFVTKGFVELPPGGTAQKTLAWRFAEGGVATITGRLGADQLPDDDVRSLVVSVPDESRALVVNGSPAAQRYRDEAFFAEAALSATGSPVRTVVRDADAAWREPLDPYDVILLLNVPAPDAAAARALRAFVEDGGGLFLSMGDRVDPDAWNAALGAVLPRRLRVVKTAVEPGQSDAQARAARLAQVALAHPVMAPFSGPAREGLLSTRFWRYALFEGDTQGVATEVLGTMDDGAPAFLASRLGKGRVFVFASTVDRDWCDLPIRTSFLPLLQRVTAWLTGTLDEREEVRARVGEAVTLQPQAGQAPVTARGPSGLEVPLTPSADGAAVTSPPLPEPGAWAVLDSGGRLLPGLGFAASIDPGASNLARHEPSALADWLGEDAVLAAGPGGAEARTPPWTWLLVTAVVALFLEGLLLRR